MFGYIKTKRTELRVREYEYYRASYCGLCRAMGKCTGQCSRLLLSYDFAFLVNLRMALNGTQPTYKRRRCIAHPFRRRTMMEVNDELRYAASASSILAYEKCRDDLHDERGFRRFKARLKCMLLHGAYRRAKKRQPELALAVREHLGRLAEKEKELRPSVDEVAVIFGDLLSDILSWGLADDKKRIAETIGRQTGRFIYIIDAIDDLAEDVEKKRFNPLALLFGGMPNEDEKKGIETALLSYLSDLEVAFDLMNDAVGSNRRAVLENILYLGMPDTIRRVLYREQECNKEETHE